MIDNVTVSQGGVDNRRSLEQKHQAKPSSPEAGSNRAFLLSVMGNRSATVKRSVFIRKQFPGPAPSKVGSTRILLRQIFSRNSATVKRDAFIRKQFPDPPPSKIGEEDLPGGFRMEAVMNGRKNPTYDLVHGIVQIDDIVVMFNAWA